MSDEQLRAALLELGLEDWIPLPEAVAAPEVRAAVASADVASAVGRVLGQPVASGYVKLFRGRWKDEDPVEVEAEDGLRLLHENRWFEFRRDDEVEERLHFVNVENLRTDSG